MLSIANDQARVGSLLTGVPTGSIVSVSAWLATMRLQSESDMRVYPDLTHALLLALVAYDPPTGTWMCRAKVGHERGVKDWIYRANAIYDEKTKTWIPTPAPLPGWIHEKPYLKNGKTVIYKERIIYTNGKPHRAARLAYFYMIGEWPPPFLEIDHINNDSLDDRWENLRLGNRQQQSANARGWSKTGYKGVAYHKVSGKFRAHITINGRQHSLGYYETPKEAYAAHCEVAQEIWGEFANVGSMPEDAV